jgi:hypothetical protein
MQVGGRKAEQNPSRLDAFPNQTGTKSKKNGTKSKVLFFRES